MRQCGRAARALARATRWGLWFLLRSLRRALPALARGLVQTTRRAIAGYEDFSEGCELARVQLYWLRRVSY